MRLYPPEQRPQPYPPDWKLSYHTGDPFAAHSPIHGGINIRNELYNSRGTLGCIVTDNATKKALFITNAHVLRPGYITAPQTFPQTGDMVLQPPGGPGNRIIGRVAKTKTARNCCYAGGTKEDIIRNNIQNNAIGDYFDAAVGYVETVYSYDIPGVGIPQGIIEPKAGMKFRALCGTSGLIGGTLTKGSYDTIGSYEQGAIHVENNVMVSSVIWKGGDSGSLLVDSASKKALGLVYATAVSKTDAGKAVTIALGCKASVIARAYNIDFKGKPGIFNADGTPYTGTPVPTPAPTPTPTPGNLYGYPLEYWVVGGVAGTAVILLLISGD